MDCNELDKLLRVADTDSPMPRLDRDLGAKVRIRARRRSRIVAAAAGFATVLLGGMAFWMWSKTFSGVAPREQIVRVEPLEYQTPVANGLDELKRLRMEAKLHAAMAERLWEGERAAVRREQMNRALSRAGALEELAAESDRAAATLVFHGDRQREGKYLAAAMRSYQIVAVSFSESRPAVAARERLRGMRGGEK